MVDTIKQSHAVQATAALASAAHSQGHEKKGGHKKVDSTLADELIALQAIAAAPVKAPLGSPELKVPAPSGNPDQALAYLVNAFAGTFTAMGNATSTEVNGLGQMQQLDQTMSQIVVASTNEAIATQLTALNLSAAINDQIAKIQAEANGVDKWLTWVGFGLVIAVTILASIPSGGATDALLPEEVGGAAGDLAPIELGEIGAGAGAGVGDISTVAEGEAALQSVEADAASDVAADDSVAADNDGAAQAKNAAKATPKEDEGGIKTIRNGDQVKQVRFGKSNLLTKMFDEIGLSPSNAERATVWFKRAMSITGSGMCALPMMLQGAASIKVGEAQEELAKTQALVGPACATMQNNSMYFQFYQQLNKRQGDMVQSLVDQAGDVITLIGGIMSGYGQIPSIITQAV
jgi:hypothetical protein